MTFIKSNTNQVIIVCFCEYTEAKGLKFTTMDRERGAEIYVRRSKIDVLTAYDLIVV